MEIGVIGGGAAGSLAAIILARGGAVVTLFEKNEKIGKKLYITGKGRCNLTNDCDIETLFGNIVHGGKFLRSALYTFKPADTMAFFEELGVPLIVERGNRVFPTSGKSSDVIRALCAELKRLRVDVRLQSEVKRVYKQGDKWQICTTDAEYSFDKVIVATGGVSYPSTGSTGDGFKFAKSLGHGVIEPRPALAPICTSEDVSSLNGLALKNVRLTAKRGSDTLASEFGELSFTSKGFSGPTSLTVSSYIARYDGVSLSLDLKPALDEAKLDARLLRDFAERQNQQIAVALRALLPSKLNLYVVARAGINPAKKVNAVTREERASLVETVKGLTFKVKCAAPFAEAVITSGGVSVDGLKPSGESKLHDGIYFVGETVDVDALTGGFNLQIAWATAYLAAKTILKEQN